MARWGEVRLGEELGPVDVELTDEHHRRFTEPLGVSLDGVVDPTIAGNLALRLLGSRYPGPVIHSHQELRFLRTVPVGSTLDMRGVISRKDVTRGKAYVAIDCDFTLDGEPAWWCRMTCVWPEAKVG